MSGSGGRKQQLARPITTQSTEVSEDRGGRGRGIPRGEVEQKRVSIDISITLEKDVDITPSFLPFFLPSILQQRTGLDGLGTEAEALGLGTQVRAG